MTAKITLIITKRSILDVATVLYSPLISLSRQEQVSFNEATFREILFSHRAT